VNQEEQEGRVSEETERVGHIDFRHPLNDGFLKHPELMPEEERERLRPIDDEAAREAAGENETSE